MATCDRPSSDRAVEVCRRWTCDRQDRADGAWNGNVMACNAGDMTTAGRSNALRLINLFRFLGDLPEVQTRADLDTKAQACALMMDANNALDHSPPTNWACYTQAGAEAAGKSNICSTGAASCMDLYMNDRGNDTTYGHRRWFLSNSLGPIGIGGTPSGSCHLVIGGSGQAKKSYLAFPSAGPQPLGAAQLADSTGWSIQSDSINLDNALVTVQSDNQSLPVNVAKLGQGYGSTWAIKIVHSWKVAAGKSYTVNVTGVATPISYVVQVLDCS
jgi:Cysteine-rich secretory protein family